MCRDVANILSPKKRLRDYDGEDGDYDGEDDVDAFLPKQCCSKRKATYDREIDLSIVGTVSNEQEELGVLYSDVSNILRKYDSIQNSAREEKGEHLNIDMQIERLSVPVVPTVTVNDDERDADR